MYCLRVGNEFYGRPSYCVMFLIEGDEVVAVLKVKLLDRTRDGGGEAFGISDVGDVVFDCMDQQHRRGDAAEASNQVFAKYGSSLKTDVRSVRFWAGRDGTASAAPAASDPDLRLPLGRFAYRRCRQRRLEAAALGCRSLCAQHGGNRDRLNEVRSRQAGLRRP